MAFDFNNQGDFLRATLGDAAAILGQFGGRNPAEWDIYEGAYNGVQFHIFQSKSEYNAALPRVTDDGGRRLAKYLTPYQDGQALDDLGRKPESFNCEILIHGDRYLSGLSKLIAEFNKPPAGDLIHPVRGVIRVKAESWTLTHSHDSRKAVLISVVFTEANQIVGDIRLSADPTSKGALTKALEAFEKISQAIEAVQVAVRYGTNLRNNIINLLGNYKTSYALILGRANQTFNSGSSADIPNLLPVNQGGLLNPDGTSAGNTFPTTQDRLSAVPIENVEQATVLSVQDLTKQTNESRAELQTIIQSMEDLGDGQGALDFHDEILGLKETAVLLQKVIETGAVTSRAQVVDFTIPGPGPMTIREVAFANGISVQRVEEIDQLNPALLSVNCIEPGTLIRVPIA